MANCDDCLECGKRIGFWRYVSTSSSYCSDKCKDIFRSKHPIIIRPSYRSDEYKDVFRNKHPIVIRPKFSTIIEVEEKDFVCSNCGARTFTIKDSKRICVYCGAEKYKQIKKVSFT